MAADDPAAGDHADAAATTPNADPRLVRIAAAFSPAEQVHLRLLLDKQQVPYVVRNERMHQLFGSGNAAIGPLEFWVRADWAAAAEAALRSSFEIDPSLVPAHCPACGAATVPGLLDCPACGLFLA